MRYWIYWNDLVQGPFELDELAALKALSEELPVCLEDRTDWLPACRIADLAPIIEQLRSTRLPPPPPPPPPSRPPAREPIQGELFTDPPEQETFFPAPGTPKGPFAFSDGAAEMRLGVFTEVRVTTPFHFSGDYRSPIAAPRPAPAPVSVQTLPPLMPVNPFVPAPTKESPIPVVEPRTEPLNHAPIPLEIYPDMPEVEELPPLAAPAPAPVVLPSVEAPAAAAAAVAPATTELPPLHLEPTADTSNTRLMAWAVGVAIGLLLLGSIGYKLFDLSTSRSAIEAAGQRQHGDAPRALTPLAVTPVVSPSLPAALPTAAPKAHAPTATSVVPHPRHVQSAKTKKAAHAALTKAMPKKSPAPVVAPAPAAAPPVVAAAPMAPTGAPTPAPAVNAAPKTFAGFGGTPSVPAAVPAAIPVAAPSAAVTTSAPAPMTPAKPDPWLNKHNEAITLVMNKKIGATPQSISARARVMLEEMHDRELLNAADTGQRLYLPDKMEWSALRENGPVYRVYMNFSALQATGERTQAISYQFEADLQHRLVSSDDKTAQADFLNATTVLAHKREARAADIENILSAVDNLNRHKMRAIIIKKNRKNKTEEANIQAGIKKAQEKLDRALAYFRTKYPDVMLQNVAHAYDFVDLVHAHV